MVRLSLLLFKLPYPAALLLVLLTATPMPSSASARYSLSRFLIRSLMEYAAQGFVCVRSSPFRPTLSPTLACCLVDQKIIEFLSTSKVGHLATSEKCQDRT